MARPDVTWLGAAKLVEANGLPAIRCFVPITDPDNDVEEFGSIPSYQALGLTALPYPPDDKGHAEGVVLRDCGNRDAVLIGARDPRAAKVYAVLQPGDTALHACSPDAKAQVRCHANRQIALVTEDSQGDTVLQLLDGKNDKVQILAFGGIFEMTPDGISIIAPGGKAGLLLQKEQVGFIGKVQLAGAAPTSSILCCDPLSLAAIQAIVPNIKAVAGATATPAP
jgi:hypothetical protein